MLRLYLPGKAKVRLHLKPGVIIVLDLGADGHMQAVLNHGNFILRKCAEPLSRHICREKRECRRIHNRVLDQSVGSAPHNVMAFTKKESVLEVEIEGVKTLGKGRRDAAVSPIVIELHLQVRAF